MQSCLPGGAPPAAPPMLWPWPTWPTLCSRPQTLGLRCAPGCVDLLGALHGPPVRVHGAPWLGLCLRHGYCLSAAPLSAWCLGLALLLLLLHVLMAAACAAPVPAAPAPGVGPLHHCWSPPTLHRPCPCPVSGCVRCQGKDGAFLSKAAQEMSSLRKLQSDLEAETGNACFLGLSVASTIQQCLRLDNAKAALHVKSSFRVSERHFALLKVRSAAGPN